MLGPLQAIPAMGNKLDTASQTGPAGAPSGTYAGHFRFDVVRR